MEQDVKSVIKLNEGIYLPIIIRKTFLVRPTRKNLVLDPIAAVQHLDNQLYMSPVVNG